MNAGFLNIVTEWLSDMKLGYCTTAFYLNENFCCWGVESGIATNVSSSIEAKVRQAVMNGIDGVHYGR